MNLNKKDLHLKISLPHKKTLYTKKFISSYYEQEALGTDQSWKAVWNDLDLSHPNLLPVQREYMD